MSAMTQTTISECFFPESEVDTLDESIDRTCSKLRTAMEDVALLRKQLRELVATKKQSAIQQLSEAKQYLESVEKQESELSCIFGEGEMVSTGIRRLFSLICLYI
jgi:phage-related tail protein